MRILGVATLVTPTGEYGGPIRVAVNQLKALQDRGHDVVLTAAYRGYPDGPPTQIDGVPARLYPARTLVPGTGFAGIGSPALWRALRANVADFDVVHVHGARDLVTLPAARIAQRRGIRTVLQTHGMIDRSGNPLAGPFDVLFTRPVLRRAGAVTYLTERERSDLEAVSHGDARLEPLANGVPDSDASVTPRTVDPRVLYLARLAPRKRPAAFVQAAAALADEFPGARFTLVGPDEGAGPGVVAAIAESGSQDRIRWTGAAAPSETLERMLEADVYVLPSVDEPYPMSVLEAMSVGLPVIVTDTCGLAGFIDEHDAGLVVDDSVESLTGALRALLADPVAAAARGARGREAVRRERGMTAIARRLEELYARTVD